MLERDPKKRATVQELREDPWLNDGFQVSLKSEEYVLVFILNH
jgi:hypothetical protein